MRITVILTFFLFFSISNNAQDKVGINLAGGSVNSFEFEKGLGSDLRFEINSANTFIGGNAGTSNIPDWSTGIYNTFLGYYTGTDNTDGAYNVFMGSYSGHNNTTAGQNTYVGYAAGYANTLGEKNSAFGTESGYWNVEGTRNTTIGYQAGYYNKGNNNTIIGYEAGQGSNSSLDIDGCVFLGYQAGYNETNNNRLYIDNSSTAEPLLYGVFNTNELEVNGDLTIDVPPGSIESRSEIKFGYHNTTEFTIDYDGSNDKFEIREGTSQILIIDDFNFGVKRTPTTNDLEVSGTASKSSAGDWLANSDARLKKNIEPLNSSLVLSNLLKLQGVTYEWNDPRETYDRPDGKQYGFTAQNIQQTFPELVSEDAEGYLQTSYGTYDAMYIEAIRELVKKIEVLEKRIRDLEQHSNLED